MKIRHRLIAGNVVVVLLVISVGVFGLFTGNNIAKTFENEEKHFRSIITSATEASSYAKRAEGHLMLFLTLSDHQDRQKFFERYASLTEEVKILNHAVKIPEAREFVYGIMANTEKLLPAGKSLIRAYERDIAVSGKFVPVRYSRDIKMFFETASEIRRLAVDLAIFEADQNFMAQKIAIQKASVLQIYSSIIIALAVIIALIQGYTLSRKIALPLSDLKEKVSEVAKGNLDVAAVHASNDEIGDLASSFNMMTIALKESRLEIISEKERLLVTLRSIGDGVITTDILGNVVLLNTVAEMLTGWTQTEAAGKPLHEIFTIIDARTRTQCENPAERVIRTRKVMEMANDSMLISRDGSERVIADSGAPILDENGDVIGVVLVFRDMTEKQKTENELIRVRNIESLGILAGGIAHDFNNILVGILGNISLAKRKLQNEDKEKIMDRLSGIEHAAQRARDLTHQLLTFAKGGAPILKTSFIGELIINSAKFALAGSNVICNYVFPDDLWPVEIDRGQFSQVIHNLIINAKWAMPEGGMIEIRAENIESGANSAAAASLPEGRHIKISFRDEGIGISSEYIDKIFDPYFTTRQKGSGLGLATVYSIVRRHRGLITVESIPGEGTTFHIFLPASDKMVTPEISENRFVQGKGRVLVMDDDDIVSEVTESMLIDLGYEPTLAINGTEAVQLFREAMNSDKPFDAVILDLTIPGGMGGKETITELLKIDSGVRAIVSSGYSADPVMAEYEKYGFRDFIKKPYSLQEISNSLQKVLS